MTFIRSITMKRVIAASFALMFILSTIVVVAQPTEAADVYPVSNSNDGEIVVFHQNYTNMYVVPDNFFLGLDTLPGLVKKINLTYDYSDHYVSMNSTHDDIGKLIICGLTPSIISNVTMEIEQKRTNFNSYHYIYTGRNWIMVQVRDGFPDFLRIVSYYYNPGLLSVTKDITDLQPTPVNSANFNLSISSNYINRTNTIYVNGEMVIHTPMSVSGVTAYDEFSTPYIIVVPMAYSAELGLEFNIRSLTQTIPKSTVITSIGNPNVVAFGVDGPHAYEYVDEGLTLLRDTGNKGTIWADPGLLALYSEENITALKALIADGWELGLHTTGSLTTLSMAAAIAYLDAQYAAVEAIFGQPPTSWCSLQNADNASHADYAYANLGMVWRNGYTGIHGMFSNIGNMADSNWITWWSKASAAGFAGPVFTHRLDTDPAIAGSTSLSNLTTFIDNYENQSMQIVSYYDYWAYAMNTYHTAISDLEMVNDSAMTFTMDNIGGKSRLLVYAPFAEMVLDANGNEVPYDVDGDNIIIDVEAGDYTIMTKSYYRQEEMVRAISPIFAIIPLVIVLSIIPMVMGFGKKR